MPPTLNLLFFNSVWKNRGEVVRAVKISGFLSRNCGYKRQLVKGILLKGGSDSCTFYSDDSLLKERKKL